MAQQWSNSVIDTVADLSGNASSAIIDISTYKKIYLQTYTGLGGVFYVEITSVPASISGGSASVPLTASWSSLTTQVNGGGVWVNGVSPEFTAKWMRVTFLGSSLDVVKATLTAQG